MTEEHSLHHPTENAGSSESGQSADPESGANRPEMERLEAELREANERVLRAQAELENFRKRAHRSAEEERKYANLPLISDLLPVLDNLERATGAAADGEDPSGLVAGVKMVVQQFKAVLEQYGCRPIEAAGTAFDPNLHEAIGKEVNDDVPEWTVNRVTQVGYRLNDRVVRPSQVMVSSRSEPAQNSSDPGDSPEEPPSP